MKFYKIFICQVVAVILIGGCTVETKKTDPIAHDPDDWPPVQRCSDLFRQEGKATSQVPSCQNVQPQVYVNLVLPAQTDADNKANLRCPSRCPTRRNSWQGNRTGCVNNNATQYITGNYQCIN
ncbi:MAG: hypothetical protein COB23_07070 [Methylophaga sp.]|nr:MAG: hypothetical protein COB23_07070 [Methylophaga sp.]